MRRPALLSMPKRATQRAGFDLSALMAGALLGLVVLAGGLVVLMPVRAFFENRDSLQPAMNLTCDLLLLGGLVAITTHLYLGGDKWTATGTLLAGFVAVFFVVLSFDAAVLGGGLTPTVAKPMADAARSRSPSLR